MDGTMAQVAIFLTVFTVAIVTPGPNFVLVVNSSLTESRQNGVLTALGIATGSALFAFAGLLGLIVVATTWAPVTAILRYAGGGYLVWVGIDSLRRLRSSNTLQASEKLTSIPTLTGSYQRGLITNLTNPKAWAFYISLFTLILKPEFTFVGKIVLTLVMFVISFAWYAFVAFMISHPFFKMKVMSAQPFIRASLGVLLLIFGIKVLGGF